MAFTQTRILSLLVLVLSLLNVGLLAMLWLGRPTQPPPRHPNAGPVVAYVVRELGLTPTQQQHYMSLRQAHQAAMRQMLPMLTERRETLFAGLAQPTTEAATQKQLLDQIAALERGIDSLTYAHFAQVGRLVTPEQLPRWQQIAPELPRMLQQQGHSNRNGPPGGPRGPRPPNNGRPEGPPPGRPE